MAIPRRRVDPANDIRPDVSRDLQAPTPRKTRVRPNRKKGLSPWGFVALAVVPVALMLGSVYLHATASGLAGESDRLTAEKARAEAETGRLEARIAELSRPERVRSIAIQDLGLEDPEGDDLKVLDGGDGKDVVRDAKENE